MTVTIGRRELLAALGGAAAAWPLGTGAQQGERVRRIGVLMGEADDPDTKARLAGLREGLERLGWSDGRNFRIDTRFAPAGTQAEGLAKELVALQPDVMLGQGTPATRMLRQASSVLP